MDVVSMPSKPWRIEQAYPGMPWSLYHTFKGVEDEGDRIGRLCDLKALFPAHNFRLTR